MSVAISVFGGMALPLDALGADESADAVVVEKVAERRFRLVNNSDETLTYMKWINQAANPVPYCKFPDGKVTICAREMHLDSDRNPAFQEARLKPGKSIVFDAMKSTAIAVGALIVVGGEKKVVWCEFGE